MVVLVLLLVLALLVRLYLGGVRATLALPAPALTAQRVDLNTATVDELAILPGVGPARGRAIAEDRERRGPFRSVDDVARVKGIGPQVLAGLRVAATVSR